VWLERKSPSGLIPESVRQLIEQTGENRLHNSLSREERKRVREYVKGRIFDPPLAYSE